MAVRGEVLAYALAVSVALIGCSSGPAPTSTPTDLPTTCCGPSTPTPAVTLPAGPSITPGSHLPQGNETIALDPAKFTNVIDNPWWPMAPGSKWVYRKVDADGAVLKVVVTVTEETKVILGITCVVVHDLVTEDGRKVEDTFDWYAQDLDGNIWYLGEDTKEFSDGEVDTTGSWEAGVDGAQAGVVMPAEPAVGLTYRQEYYEGEAEDQAEVLSLDERAEVAAGAYEGLLMTKDFTPLDPASLEYKFYAAGVGPVLLLTVSGGSDREELTKFTPAEP